MKTLLVIDIQKELTHRAGIHKPGIFFDTVNAAIRKFREAGKTIVFIQHNSKLLEPGTHAWEIDERIDRNFIDKSIQKQHGNAFTGTDLRQYLSSCGTTEVLICGMVTHQCVKATATGSVRLGYATSLLKNGHTNFHEDAAGIISRTEAALLELGVKTVDLQDINC